jgi:hypothetical protein
MTPHRAALHRSLGGQQQRPEHRQRREHIQQPADQIDPEVPQFLAERLANPRTIAIATASPTAPLWNEWTVIPAICEKFESVVSPG